MKKLGKEARLTGLEQRLDGGSCLNQRSILLACEVFSSKPLVNRDLKLADLLEALWVLELVIVSKNLSYDGTLPEKDISDIERETAALVKGTRYDERYFGAIKPRNEKEQLGFVKSAALKALDDIGCLTQPLVSDRSAVGFIPELQRFQFACSQRTGFNHRL